MRPFQRALILWDNTFDAIVEKLSVARRQYFGLRGPTSKKYYTKRIWDRNHIFMAIFLICNGVNIYIRAWNIRDIWYTGWGHFGPPHWGLVSLKRGLGGLNYLMCLKYTLKPFGNLYEIYVLSAKNQAPTPSENCEESSTTPLRKLRRI